MCHFPNELGGFGEGVDEELLIGNGKVSRIVRNPPFRRATEAAAHQIPLTNMDDCIHLQDIIFS